MKHNLIYIPLAIFAWLLVSCNGGGSNTESDNDTVRYYPTAFYSFDEGDGDIAYNSEFDAFHGEIIDASREAGKIGNALNFSDLEGAHVLFDICCYEDPNTGEGAMWVSFPENSLTIAAWLKPTAMSIDKIYPIFGGSYSGVQSMKLRVNSGAVEFLLYKENNGGIMSIITSASTLENDAWTHVAVTYDGSQAIIYINGIEDNSSDIIMPIQNIINDYFIGGIPIGSLAGPSEHSFPGEIDEFLLTSIKYSPSDIWELFESGF